MSGIINAVQSLCAGDSIVRTISAAPVCSDGSLLLVKIDPALTHCSLTDKLGLKSVYIIATRLHDNMSHETLSSMGLSDPFSVDEISRVIVQESLIDPVASVASLPPSSSLSPSLTSMIPPLRSQRHVSLVNLVPVDSVNHARMILASYTAGSTNNSNAVNDAGEMMPLPPLLVLCQGEVVQGGGGVTTVLGQQVHQPKGDSKDNRTIDISIYSVKHSVSDGSESAVKVYNTFRHTASTPPSSQVSLQAQYELWTESAPEGPGTVPHPHCSSVQLLAQWTAPYSNVAMLAPPPPQAEAALTLRGFPFALNTDSLAGHMVSQLQVLQGLEKLVGGGGGDGTPSSSAPTGQLLSRINALLHPSSFRDGSSNSNSGSTSTEGTSSTNNSASKGGDHVVGGKGRTDLDFAEKIWNVLQDYALNDAGVIRGALEVILDTITAGSALPQVNKSNTTLIGTVLREAVLTKAGKRYGGESATTATSSSGSSSSSSDCASITHSPLQSLLELGVYKVTRDYSFAFTAHGLASQDQIGVIMNNNLSSSSSVERLKRLHNVLEMSLVCEESGAPANTVKALTLQAIDYYKDNCSSSLPLFTLPLASPLPPRMIRDLVHPTHWAMKMQEGHSVIYSRFTPPPTRRNLRINSKGVEQRIRKQLLEGGSGNSHGHCDGAVDNIIHAMSSGGGGGEVYTTLEGKEREGEGEGKDLYNMTWASISKVQTMWNGE